MASAAPVSAVLALCSTPTTVANAPRRFRIGLAIHKYVYEPMYKDTWKCAISASGWGAANDVVLWLILEDSKVTAFHAPVDCASKDAVLQNGSPVFKCCNRQSVMAAGEYEWQYWVPGPVIVDEIEESGRWLYLNVFETTFLE